MDTSRLTSKAADEIRRRRANAAAMVPAHRPRPMWQTGLMWLAGGMVVTWLAAFFFDSRRGSARRHMAVDRTVATGRDVGRWTGKKARHLRNKATGAVAEIRGATDEKKTMTAGGG
jgi:hypothetical protein